MGLDSHEYRGKSGKERDSGMQGLPKSFGHPLHDGNWKCPQVTGLPFPTSVDP